MADTEKKADGMAIPPELPGGGDWTPRLMMLRETVEGIGKDLGWEDDWMPMLLVDGIMPEEMPGGKKVPPEEVGTRTMLVVGLPDSMRNEESKDYTATIMTMIAIRMRAYGMTFISTVWMSHMTERIEPAAEGESDEDAKERAYAAARRHGPPSQDPNRIERLMLHSIYFGGGPEDGQKLAFAEIKREEGKPPKLHGWTLWDDGQAGASFAGRFPDAIWEGLKIAWDMRAKEANEKEGGNEPR